MRTPFKVPALRNNEMRAKLDSKVAISCSLVFQLPSTFGLRLEQSRDTAFSLSGRSTKRGDFDELEAPCGRGEFRAASMAGVSIQARTLCRMEDT